MQLESPETWEEVGIDAILQDERRLIALLEAVAVKLNRSVDSVRRELSLGFTQASETNRKFLQHEVLNMWFFCLLRHHYHAGAWGGLYCLPD